MTKGFVEGKLKKIKNKIVKTSKKTKSFYSMKKGKRECGSDKNFCKDTCGTKYRLQ